MGRSLVTKFRCLMADIGMVKGAGESRGLSSDKSLACRHGRCVGLTVGREAEVCMAFSHVPGPCPPDWLNVCEFILHRPGRNGWAEN